MRRFLPLLLISAAVSVYGVTARFQLLHTLDDKYYLLLNDTVKEFSVSNLKHAFSDYYVGNYAPVHIISYMVDHSLWGFEPAGYHLENVLFHLLNGVLFFLLLRRLDLTEWQAAAAAWIFMFHPVQVETVAWVSQRKNLLAMFFFLLACLGYHAYATGKRRNAPAYALSLLSTVAALLSKSVTVIIPVVLVLYEFTYYGATRRSRMRRSLDLVPYVVAAAVVALVAMKSQSIEFEGGRRDFPGGSPLTAFYTMVPVLMEYIRDCFWPFEISPYYMVVIRQQPDSVFMLSTAALAGLIALGGYMYVTCRRVLFWYGLFFIALLPVLQIVPLITLKNDRYLYFPLLGFAVVMVCGASRLHMLATAGWRKLCRAAVIMTLASLPLLALRQTLFWKDDITLWSRAVQVDPENRLAWLHLTKMYTARNDGRNAFRALGRYQELRRKYGPVRGFELE